MEITQSVDILPFEDSAAMPIADIFVPLLLEEDNAIKKDRPSMTLTDEDCAAKKQGPLELKTKEAKPKGKFYQLVKKIFFGKKSKKQAYPKDEEKDVSFQEFIEDELGIQKLFCDGKKSVERIFIKGEAGFGKTLFCLKLLDIWCKLKNQREGGEIERNSADFDLVFYVPIRQFDSSRSNNSIVDIVCGYVSKGCTEVKNRAKLLLSSREIRCLVILDGLDEGLSMGIKGLPDEHGLVNTVLLCTARPWKIAQSRLGYKQNDKDVEIVGLSSSNQAQVIENVLVHFTKLNKDMDTFKDKLHRFTTLAKTATYQSLIQIPMMLTALCYMWHEEDSQTNDKPRNATSVSPSVQDSVTHTFLSLVEAMIRRADEKHDLKSLISAVNSKKQPNIPKVLAELSCVTDYIEALMPFCRLGYDDFVSDESMLVFRKNQLEKDIDPGLVQLALKIGLVNQTKAPSRFHQQNIGISFYHLSMQELMAALYIACGSQDVMSSFIAHLSSV